MLHFLPETPAVESPEPYAEAVARLAGIRHALALVEPFAGGPAPDLDQDEEIGAAWVAAGGAKRRTFDRSSERVIAGTAAGLEALLAERNAGREANPAAQRRIAEEIRTGLEALSRQMLGGEAAGRQPDLPYPIAL